MANLAKTSKATKFASYIFGQGYQNNIKINKLLYISFGFFGAKTKQHLFNDVIEAWQFGHVIPNVYYAFNEKILTQIKPVMI